LDAVLNINEPSMSTSSQNPQKQPAQPKKGGATRERILAMAEELILEQGYTATSIGEILERSHITKGGFFYHFEGKNDLAVALMERYRNNDRIFFTGLSDQARALVEDPLQQMLLFLKLLADALGNLPDVHPGCLVATFVYEASQVEDSVHRLNEEVLKDWRALFREHLDLIDEQYEKRIEVDNDVLSDALTSALEGGIIISKALQDQRLLPNQILQYRNYIKLIYGIET
jgi:AcrR family transcriptional regulator